MKLEDIPFIDTEAGKDKAARKYIRAIHEALLADRVTTPLPTASEGITSHEGFTVGTSRRDDTVHVMPKETIEPGTIEDRNPDGPFVYVKDATSEGGFIPVPRDKAEEVSAQMREQASHAGN